MRRLALIVLAAAAIPGLSAAQTWGQPHYGASGAAYGQPRGDPALGYGHRGSGQGYGSATGYGDPRAWRPPARYGYGYGYGDRYDRGGRYGYSRPRSGEWTRWSSPPGRGYHDVYGYNDDRAPRGADYGRHPERDCSCGVGGYLYDR